MPDEARPIPELNVSSWAKTWMGTSGASEGRARLDEAAGRCLMGEMNPVYIADSTHESQQGAFVYRIFHNAKAKFHYLK
jgi:hypothetical protein